jgi:hypothetical protein
MELSLGMMSQENALGRLQIIQKCQTDLYTMTQGMAQSGTLTPEIYAKVKKPFADTLYVLGVKEADTYLPSDEEVKAMTANSRDIITITVQVRNRIYSIGLTKKIAIILVATLLLFCVALTTRTNRDYCSACFDFWQKIRLGEVVAEYQLIAPQHNLVKGLENFPTNLTLAKIDIKLPESGVLKAVYISAIDNKGYDIGNWVTEPISYLWGIGIVDELSHGQLINSGLRRENLRLPVSRELSLLISDNGNLSIKPNFYIQIYYEEGRRVSTIAGYKR